MNIHQRIKQARKERDLSMEKLGEIVGVSWQTVQQWEKENGTAPKRKRLEQVAAALGKTPEYLLRGDPESDFVMVPLIDAKLSAGSGAIIYSTDEKKSLQFRVDYLRKKGTKPENVMVLNVTGDSMVDKHIVDGSTVLIDTLAAKNPISNLIYGLWIGDEIFIKELVKLKSGDWVARSHNAQKDYPDIPIKTENNGIIGRVIWCGFEV